MSKLTHPFKWLLPQDNRFEALFREDAANLREAGKVFLSLVKCKDLDSLRERAKELKDLEHRGDEITRSIFETLNKTFLTPLDREDIRDLASGIDNVLDDMEMVGSLLVQFKLTGSHSEALYQMSEILAETTEEIEKLSGYVWDPGKLDATERGLIRISELENQADALFNLMITQLFDPASDLRAVEIMKWKEVYQALEDSIDRSKEVSHAIGNIVTKNG
jgi:predicted phosphate transport protein (TIGR00153 family)